MKIPEATIAEYFGHTYTGTAMHCPDDGAMRDVGHCLFICPHGVFGVSEDSNSDHPAIRYFADNEDVVIRSEVRRARTWIDHRRNRGLSEEEIGRWIGDSYAARPALSTESDAMLRANWPDEHDFYLLH